MATASVERTAPAGTAAAEEPLFEIVGGRRVELPPMGAFETALSNWLWRYLLPYALETDLGFPYNEMLFDLGLPDRSQRRPDLAFVTFERWPRERPVPRMAAWRVVPDLAVEVVSPTDKADELIVKVREYLQAGVRVVWVLYPSTEELHVFDAADPTIIRVVRHGDEIDGGAILPGFRLPLAALFPGEPEPSA
jgi:Uma2 family endonuclease